MKTMKNKRDIIHAQTDKHNNHGEREKIHEGMDAEWGSKATIERVAGQGI